MGWDDGVKGEEEEQKYPLHEKKSRLVSRGNFGVELAGREKKKKKERKLKKQERN